MSFVESQYPVTMYDPKLAMGINQAAYLRNQHKLNPMTRFKHENPLAMKKLNSMARWGGAMFLATTVLKTADVLVGSGLGLISGVTQAVNKLGSREFGNGRALTTKQSGTERERALKRIQANKMGPRSNMGREAQFINY